MKISDDKATVVSIPYKAPLRWAMGCHRGTTRTIVEVSTDEGIVGIGETIGAASTTIINKDIKPELLGGDPFNIEHLVMMSLWTT